MRDYFKNGREIDAAHADTPTPDFLDKALELAKNEKHTSQRPSDEEFKQNVKSNLIFWSKRPHQFISFLQKIFPQAQLSLLVHASTDEYLQYLDDNKLSYPSVITAVDIEDEMSLMRGSTTNYLKLCVLSLQQNPSSKNFFLSRGKNRCEPEISSFFLEEVEGGVKENTNGELNYAPKIQHIWTVTKKMT